MTNDDTKKLYGSLLEWPVRSIERADLVNCSAVRFVKSIGQSKWEEFEYLSDDPLRTENTDQVTGPYRYSVICRRSGPRIAILSSNRRIVDHLAERLVAEVFTVRLRNVSIAVDTLLKTLVARPTRYCVDFAYARVPAFGAALRNISFYGDDLGDASLFRENIQLMNFFVCGLRSATGGSEIVRLSSDGRISFNMHTQDTVLEVEKVLVFLRKHEYLSTEIWPQG